MFGECLPRAVASLPAPPTALRRRVRGMLMSGKQFSLDSRMDIVSTMASSAEGEAAGEHQTSENGKNREQDSRVAGVFGVLRMDDGRNSQDAGVH